MIVINFKTYKQGKEVLKLIKVIEKYLPNSIICLQPTDLHFSKQTKLKVYSQNIESFESGRNTGHIITKAIKLNGAKGSLLNHSEYPVSIKQINLTIKKCKELGIKLIVCSSSLKEIKEIKKLRPYAIAYEDKNLISTGKSITEHKSKDIKVFVKILKNTKIIPLCGAGISSAKDVKEAKKLGCKGVLISSAIVKTKNPRKILLDLKKL